MSEPTLNDLNPLNRARLLMDIGWRERFDHHAAIAAVMAGNAINHIQEAGEDGVLNESLIDAYQHAANVHTQLAQAATYAQPLNGARNDQQQLSS